MTKKIVDVSCSYPVLSKDEILKMLRVEPNMCIPDGFVGIGRSVFILFEGDDKSIEYNIWFTFTGNVKCLVNNKRYQFATVAT